MEKNQFSIPNCFDIPTFSKSCTNVRPDIDLCQWFQASSLDARTVKTKATISRMMARIAIPHDQLRSTPKNVTMRIYKKKVQNERFITEEITFSHCFKKKRQIYKWAVKIPDSELLYSAAYTTIAMEFQNAAKT